MDNLSSVPAVEGAPNAQYSARRVGKFCLVMVTLLIQWI